MIKINIAKDFSDALGGRYYSDGRYSGQEFYETLLKNKFLEALENKEKLVINLDGTYGYPSSFIDESFGQLAGEFGEKQVLKNISFISEDQPSLIEEICSYIVRGAATRGGAKHE